jgi:signal transduction histidine kinase
MNLPFDRDMELKELLDPSLAKKLAPLLDRTFGPRWRILDPGGACLMGNGNVPGDDAAEAPLRLDFEVVGKLSVSGGSNDEVQRLADWMELVLAGAYRYRMAADIHMEAVHADYEALQKKHADLQASEARYRELAFELERKVAEQVELIMQAQRQLYQTEKMASVGSLAAGMAHEINNPIGFIRSNAATSLDYVEKLATVLQAYRKGAHAQASAAWDEVDLDFIMEDFPTLIQESISGADRVARIIANLKRYASIDYALSAEVDLNEAVKIVAAIVADQLPENVRFETDLHPLPRLVCDQGRINQMLLSLVQNAVQATSGKGVVRVTTGVESGEIRIAVTDDGVGIAPDILTRIFDPFFTTREVGQGTGLGLTVSRDIAVAHGGRIEVSSVQGSGSTFTLCLPVDRDNTRDKAN